jgi:hypothetical protein
MEREVASAISAAEHNYQSVLAGNDGAISSWISLACLGSSPSSYKVSVASFQGVSLSFVLFSKSSHAK